jgi:hypothetical protein
LSSGKPSPPIRYSDIVDELEKEFPGKDIDDIHKIVGERLKDLKERLRNRNRTQVAQLTIKVRMFLCLVRLTVLLPADQLSVQGRDLLCGSRKMDCLARTGCPEDCVVFGSEFCCGS